MLYTFRCFYQPNLEWGKSGGKVFIRNEFFLSEQHVGIQNLKDVGCKLMEGNIS